MARLIDADKYMETARSKLDMQDLYLPVTIKDFVIDKMPTVEAIPIEWLTAQAENPSNSDAIRNALDYIVYTLWAERKEE